ncbi:unnamed protein product [Spirodela intermedia]|uniref:Uncharacterized protein n=1 Tax=Spirodela intermedia TaxID=51605 RepID=A0A7I8L491_SPIIN|nr:unnamed protein product [Spirodela intermedia]
MSLPSLPTASFLFLTLTAAFSAQRSNGEPGFLSFVVSAYVLLVLFLISLHWFETVPHRDAATKIKGKALITILATSLNLLFSWRVSSQLPAGFAAFIWAVATTTAGAEFYLLFYLKEV